MKKSLSWVYLCHCAAVYRLFHWMWSSVVACAVSERETADGTGTGTGPAIRRPDRRINRVKWSLLAQDASWCGITPSFLIQSQRPSWQNLTKQIKVLTFSTVYDWQGKYTLFKSIYLPTAGSSVPHPRIRLSCGRVQTFKDMTSMCTSASLCFKPCAGKKTGPIQSLVNLWCELHKKTPAKLNICSSWGVLFNKSNLMKIPAITMSW